MNDMDMDKFRQYGRAIVELMSDIEGSRDIPTYFRKLAEIGRSVFPQCTSWQLLEEYKPPESEDIARLYRSVLSITETDVMVEFQSFTTPRDADLGFCLRSGKDLLTFKGFYGHSRLQTTFGPVGSSVPFPAGKQIRKIIRTIARELLEDGDIVQRTFGIVMAGLVIRQFLNELQGAPLPEGVKRIGMQYEYGILVMESDLSTVKRIKNGL